MLIILPCLCLKSSRFPFPVSNKPQKSDLDAVIDEALRAIPRQDRERLRFELIKTIDSYDAFFTEWFLSLPEESNETLGKQIYDIAHQEHDRKLHMLKDIMRLKIKVLVAEYQPRK
ncbi:hypothetical protein NP590_10320 [Methylomonas sp. SURF-2]|uniref:Uncharacterized protein n=1 Tax=Methylomonas subterranea TaxID=2952225 RepID=A0ABT1TGA8_9GAMM|nr:hypothetical protein [Methylomonas sp. SURF-2]MCQ8104498.1 hypothetical protein [Methylomonas sp. SURF-2]